MIQVRGIEHVRSKSFRRLMSYIVSHSIILSRSTPTMRCTLRRAITRWHRLSPHGCDYCSRRYQPHLHLQMDVYAIDNPFGSTSWKLYRLSRQQECDGTPSPDFQLAAWRELVWHRRRHSLNVLHRSISAIRYIVY